MPSTHANLIPPCQQPLNSALRVFTTGALAIAMTCGGCASGSGNAGSDESRLSSSMGPAAAPAARSNAQAVEVDPAPRTRQVPPTPPVSPSTSPAIEQTQNGNAHDAAIRAAAETELGPAVAASMPTVPPSTPPEPIDVGAADLMASIANALGDRSSSTDGVTLVNVRGVRNLSRTNAAEFESFMHRFREVMTRAGANRRIAFTDDAAAAAQYQLEGTVYMTYAEGFDQWELYLSLRPTDRDFDVWNASAPVRVLRIVRPGIGQITYGGK